MIVLIGVTIKSVLLGMLTFSLAILVFIIAYRKFLAYLGKGRPVPDNYCVLYSLEANPVCGDVEIYFTTKIDRNVVIELLDSNFQVIKELFNDFVKEGGQIVRLNTKELSNGVYHYQLVTENQKTMKKMNVRND